MTVDSNISLLLHFLLCPKGTTDLSPPFVGLSNSNCPNASQMKKVPRCPSPTPTSHTPNLFLPPKTLIVTQRTHQPPERGRLWPWLLPQWSVSLGPPPSNVMPPPTPRRAFAVFPAMTLRPTLSASSPSRPLKPCHVSSLSTNLCRMMRSSSSERRS